MRMRSINIFSEYNRFLSFFHGSLPVLSFLVDLSTRLEPFTGALHFFTGLSRVFVPAARLDDCRLGESVL